MTKLEKQREQDREKRANQEFYKWALDFAKENPATGIALVFTPDAYYKAINGS